MLFVGKLLCISKDQRLESVNRGSWTHLSGCSSLRTRTSPCMVHAIMLIIIKIFCFWFLLRCPSWIGDDWANAQRKTHPRLKRLRVTGFSEGWLCGLQIFKVSQKQTSTFPAVKLSKIPALWICLSVFWWISMIGITESQQHVMRNFPDAYPKEGVLLGTRVWCFASCRHQASLMRISVSCFVPNMKDLIQHRWIQFSSATVTLPHQCQMTF